MGGVLGSNRRPLRHPFLHSLLSNPRSQGQHMDILLNVAAENLELWLPFCPSSSGSAIHDYCLQPLPVAALQAHSTHFPLPTLTSSPGVCRPQNRSGLQRRSHMVYPTLPGPIRSRVTVNTSSPAEYKHNSKHNSDKASPVVCIYASPSVE